MGYGGEVAAEHRALEGGDAVWDAVPLRLVDGRAERDDGGDERGRAVASRVVQWPCVDELARDADVVVDVEAGVGGTQDGPEADRAIEQDAAREVGVFGAAEQEWGEQLGQGGVRAGEVA